MALLSSRRQAGRSQASLSPTDARPRWWRRLLPDPIRRRKVQALQRLMCLAASSDEYAEMLVLDCTGREHPTVELFLTSGPHYRIPVTPTRRVVEVRQGTGGGSWWFAEVDGESIDRIDRPQATLRFLWHSMLGTWEPFGSASVLETLTDGPDDDDDDDYEDVPPTIVAQPSGRIPQQRNRPYERVV